MSVIETALADSASRDDHVSATHSPTIEEAFGGPENLKLLQGVLDDLGNEELTVEQTNTTTPHDSAAPQPPAPPKETPALSSESAHAHTVISGDTLSQIAIDNGVTLEALIAANPQFAANPDLIYPGQQVKIPSGQDMASETEPESEQVAYVGIPPAADDPLLDSMGRLATDTESDRNWINQLNDIATQSNTIGSFDLSA
jgi:LysM repeat protein